ncbi:MAG: polymer-forming cytoskeletal protein [Oscillospiraceae bacterium]|nr:polymer-forming cytoskeletal protein [Oscillospiraceae bacterium]
MIKEKARKPHRRVKGTVLFTVVCIMMVLIVFLMGTLALAATANRRANFKYQRAQNETIARTVIDAVVTDIKNDTSTDGLNNALANKTSFDMEVELDGRQYPVSVSRSGKQCWYDATLGWVEGDIINLTATVASQAGNEPVNYNASIVMAITTVNNNPNINPNPAGGAFVSLGNISPKIGTTGLTTGGTEVNLGGSPTDYVQLGHSNSTLIETPVYINGEGHMETDIDLYIPSMQYTGDDKKPTFFAITGDLYLQNSPLRSQFGTNMKWLTQTNNTTDVTNYANIPCMYVGGTVFANTKEIELGDANNAMNMYCGSFETGVGMKVNGDIYCFDASKTSKSGGTATATNALYEWAEKQIKNPEGNTEAHTFGNIYSKGNLDLAKSGSTKFTTDGDIRAEGNIKLNGCEIGGDVVCGKTLIIGDDVIVHGNIYADVLIVTATNGVTCDNCYVNTLASGKVTAAHVYYGQMASSITITNVVTSTVWVQENPYYGYDAEKVEYDMVINNGGSSITVHQEKVGGNSEHVTAPSSIASATIVGGDHPNSTGNISATEYKKGSHNVKIYPTGFTQADILTNIITVPQASSYTDPTSFPTTRAELNALVTILDSNNNLIIPSVNLGSTTANNIITNSCICSGTACQDYTFKPNGTMAVILDNANMGGHKFIIDDTNGTVLFFVEGSFENSAQGGAFLNKHYYDLIYANPSSPSYTFSVNRTTLADYPNVYVYGAAGSSINMDANTIMTANIRAPKTIYKGATGRACNITYTDSDTTTMSYIGVIGQCIAGEIEVDNGWGLAYVEPGNNGGNPNPNPNQPQNNPNQTVTYSTNGGSINYTIY